MTWMKGLHISAATEQSPIKACTVSRDVQNFDLLIEDMETCLGDAWGDLPLATAATYLSQHGNANFEFIALAIDADDEAEIDMLLHIVKEAKAKNIKVILISEDVSSTVLHNLLNNGADVFAPYPLPEGELASAIEKIRMAPAQAQAAPAAEPTGQIIAIQGMAGGVGASTFATNFAWDLAQEGHKLGKSVCLIDMGMQFGTVATYLDLNRPSNVLQMWQDTSRVDTDSFKMALHTVDDHLKVMTGPNEIVPMDLIDQDDVKRILDFARAEFDYIILDMPNTLQSWTDTVMGLASTYYGLLEIDMRSAQNVVRLKNMMMSEAMDMNNFAFILNRAPKITDLAGKSRAKRLAETLEIEISLQLPDGGCQVTQANDNGEPLGAAASNNVLRKEIAKLAKSLLNDTDNQSKVA